MDEYNTGISNADEIQEKLESFQLSEDQTHLDLHGMLSTWIGIAYTLT
jgi:hypothetical protein